jgi:hypothetical protein
MEASRNPRTLIRWSSALAACGALILVAAGYFLATTSLISGFSPTYIFVPPVVTACFVVASIVVFVASAFVRHIANHRLVALAKRRSLMAIIGTVAGWLTAGITALLLTGH